jgi:hypothetical protein
MKLSYSTPAVVQGPTCDRGKIPTFQLCQGCGEGMDYSQIFSRLFVGSYLQTIGDIDRLQRDLAVTAVLNLQTDA